MEPIRTRGTRAVLIRQRASGGWYGVFRLGEAARNPPLAAGRDMVLTCVDYSQLC